MSHSIKRNYIFYIVIKSSMVVHYKMMSIKTYSHPPLPPISVMHPSLIEITQKPRQFFMKYISSWRFPRNPFNGPSFIHPPILIMHLIATSHFLILNGIAVVFYFIFKITKKRDM